MPPPFTTSEPERGASCPVPDATPLSYRSSAYPRQESGADQVEECDSAYYEVAHGDLRSRVFVDFEVFMKNALHVPDDWKTRWGPAIEAIKADLEFKKYLEEHRRHCGMPESQKASFYEPLTNTARAALNVLSRSIFDRASFEDPQSHHVNDTEEDLQWTSPLHLLGVRAYGSAICNGKNLPRMLAGGEDPTSPPCVWT